MKKPHFKQLFFSMLILAFLGACTGPAKTQIPPTLSPSPTTTPALPTANQKSPDYWPTQDWRTSTPEQQGMDSARISTMFDAIQLGYPYVHSVLIVRNGTIVTEAYYAPFRPDARHNIVTITESIVSILIGIAIQQGSIQGVDQKMLDFFPDRKIANLDAVKQAITIRDLLSMTSGLLGVDVDSSGVLPDDWVQDQLDMPMNSKPGIEVARNRGGYILLTAIIQKATGMTALAFANKVLFGPLGISGAAWETDSKGIENGGNRLYLTSRDLAKIGYLYLNNGEWNGKQVVPKEYVLASTKHQFDIASSPGWGIGYGWWIAHDGSYSSEVLAGELIAVKPEQGIVAVFTGSSSDDLSSEEQGLVDHVILPAVKSSGALPENPASMVVLNDQIAALKKDAPGPIPPSPKLAQTISGKGYLLEDGEAFKLSFAGDQATLDWSLKDQSLHLPIGMDHVFITTAVDQTERLSPFGADPKTLNPGFVALRGIWTDDVTFELTMQFLNSTRRQTVSFIFAEDKVNIIQTNMNGISPVTVPFKGQVQGPSSTTTTPAPAGLARPTATPIVLGVVKGRIAFHSNRSGNNEIYVMNGDGSGLTNLTNNPADDIGPVWSPDGKKILFLTNRDGNYEIYVMNADGSDPTNLTHNPADDGDGILLEAMDWSPDGKKIVFHSKRKDNGTVNEFGQHAPDWEIYVMNADGSNPTNLTRSPASDDAFPKWSADGKQIGFTSDRSGDGEIYVMNANGSNVTQLTHNGADNVFPRWSPDGKKIVFVHGYGDGSYEIYLMNADGSHQVQLTDSPRAHDNNMDARWSPDGTQIIFWSSRDGNAELYVMNANGSNQTRLTDNPANDYNPMIQP